MSSHTTLVTAPIVTVFGGSGFVGRYIVQALAKEGWRVRVAVRRPNEAIFTMTYGNVGQVQPVQANIRDEDSTADAIRGAQAVVNCVGILYPHGKQTLDTVQVEGAGRIARLAAAAGVQKLVHLSAIGADAGSDSANARTKGEGERAVLNAFPDATILRPSVVFGPEDEFFNRFAQMATKVPVLPVIGGTSRFQPVFVDDVAMAAATVLRGDAAPDIYELGGPDVETFRELMQRLVTVIRRRRVLLTIPMWAARLQARLFGLGSKLTFGLIPNSILTLDQVRQLGQDNVVGEGVKTFADLNIKPRDMDAILDSYMWPYRPHGQYSEILESAKNLR